MRGARSIGRRGVGRLTPYTGRGRDPSSRRGWERFQIGCEVIDPHMIKGLVDQVLVSRIQNFFHGPWGHLIGGGRADAGGATVSYACGGRRAPSSSSAMLGLLRFYEKGWAPSNYIRF